MSLLLVTLCAFTFALEGPLAHWPLAGDGQDISGNGHHAINHGVDLSARGPDRRINTAGRFNGKSSWLEVPAATGLSLGSKDFSIVATILSESNNEDSPGDILCKYDEKTRTGINLTLYGHAGVTTSQPHERMLCFGIDAARSDAQWTDRGRPGEALYVFALAVHEGQLYAGTFETGADQAGRVYRYAGGNAWVDCRIPSRCNAVMSFAVFNGRLYAGVGGYNPAGSALPPSPNHHPGGNVYRLEPSGKWTDCGKLGIANEAFAMAVHSQWLYAIPLYSQGLFRFDGRSEWTDCGSPGRRLMSLTSFNGDLLAAANEGGGVIGCAPGGKWNDIGKQEGVHQVYGFCPYRGVLHVATWPEGKVFRNAAPGKWVSAGRLGDELEVMGMMVYNGKLYGGTLPLAQVYRHDGPDRWTLTGRLDQTEDVKYRRAWSMAMFQGQLFCGALPSGHVYSFEAGKSVTHDRSLPQGWRHIAAVRKSGSLQLYVDGRRVATSSAFDPKQFDLTNSQPIRIGAGQFDYFNGRMQNIRLYGRALSPSEIESQAAEISR